MRIDLDKYIKKKHNLVNKRLQTLVAWIFGKKVTYVTILMTIILGAMYLTSLLSGKVFPFSTTLMVIIMGTTVQMLFSNKGFGIIKSKDFSTKVHGNGEAHILFDEKNNYAEERVGRSFIRYNLTGCSIKDYIDDTVVLLLRNGKECTMIDDVNPLNKENSLDFVKKASVFKENEIFKSGKKELDFSKAIKVKENKNYVIDSFIRNNLNEIKKFVNGFDKVIVAYIIFLFSMFGTVLAIDEGDLIIPIILVAALGGIFVALFGKKSRLTFKVKFLNLRELNVFDTGLYYTDDFIEEYYSFNDLYKVEEKDSKVVLYFGVGEMIGIDKADIEANPQKFEIVLDFIKNENRKEILV